MCGIAAIIYKNQPTENQMWVMLDAIRHRGNVAPNFEMFGNSVLGNVRLQIVDRPHGNQPIYNEANTMAVIFNGEIYNYKALKLELENTGHVFRTDCDTEVLIHLFEEYGPEMLRHLDGMYAFVIYNNSNNTFFAARDLFGIKPLYYCENSEAFYFSSELKSFLTLKEVEEYKELAPASYLYNGSLHTYYRYKTTPKILTDFAVTANTVNELTVKAVKKRVQTDLPIGVFLSGGIDSTIVFLLCREYHPDVTAIIIGEDNAPDVIYARNFCEENRYKYNHVNIDKKQLFEIIPLMVQSIETFEANPVRGACLSYYLSKAAHDLGLRVVVCGEGSDEIFAGYGDFLNINSEDDCEKFTISFIAHLYRTQLLRIDRTGMAFGVEVREPFMDKALVEYALRIPFPYKVATLRNKRITKAILREAFKDILPAAIYMRDKMTLMEGAGAGVVNKGEGIFFEHAKSQITDEKLAELKIQFPEYKIENKEVAFYFEIFKEHFLKAKFAVTRTFNATKEIKGNDKN